MGSLQGLGESLMGKGREWGARQSFCRPWVGFLCVRMSGPGGGGGRHLQRWMHNASAPPSAKEAGSIAPPSSLKWGVATPGDQGGAYAAAPHPALGPPDSWPRLCAPGFPHPGLIV